MNLFGYINKKINNKNKEEYKIENLQIDEYPLLSQSKRDLLKEMYCYIPPLSFEDVRDRYENKKEKLVHIQTLYLEKNDTYTRGLIDISRNSISREGFFSIFNKNRVYGPQKYVEICLGDVNDPNDFKNKMIIYFYSDGAIFMNQEVASYLSTLRIDDFSSLLASKCIQLKEFYENNEDEVFLSLKNRNY